MEALTVTGRDRENTRSNGNDLQLFTVADIHASLQNDEQFQNGSETRYFKSSVELLNV